MSEFSELTRELGPTGASADFLDNQSAWIQDQALKLGVSVRFISTRTLLHLPHYTEDHIRASEGLEVANYLEPKVAYLGSAFRIAYDSLGSLAQMKLVTPGAKIKGRKELYAEDGTARLGITFGSVPSELAREAYTSLHYIGSAREDSILECGLYLADSEAPYAYASFSRCGRGYQINALNKAAGLQLDPSEVMTMSRAFAFDGAPTNSMSKLFYLAHEQIRQQFPNCKAIVTALNPYLKFEGGIFTGASYTPYATAPMEYWYDSRGFYVPRSKGTSPQQLETPPIIWLAHGLDRATSCAIEGLQVSSIVQITKDEYKNG